MPAFFANQAELLELGSLERSGSRTSKKPFLSAGSQKRMYA
jgi:hypothetical protein